MLDNIKQILRESILEHLLLEDRMEFVQNKYKSAITPEIFELLKEADPTTKKIYLDWVIKQYLKLGQIEKKRFVREDFSKIADDLALFDKYKHKIQTKEFRDINKLLSFDDLHFVVKPLYELQKKEKETEESNKVTKLYSGEDYEILIPETEASSCKYGAGSRWCTSSERNNMFDTYTNDGPLFMVIHKKDLDSEGRANKYQFHFETSQFMDVNDHAIEFRKYIDENPLVGDVLKNFFLNNNYGGKQYTIHEIINNISKMGMVGEIPNEFIKKAEKEGGLKLLEIPVLYDFYKANKISFNTLTKGNNDKTLAFTKDGKAFVVYNDWSDESLSDLFGMRGNTDYNYGAKQVFGGDIYDWFDGVEGYKNLSDFDINDNAIKQIKEKIINSNLSSEDGVKLTKEYIDALPNDELLTLINDDSNLEEIKNEIINGANDAYRDAQESAYWNGYKKEVEDLFGSKYKFINDKLMFEVDFPYWVGKIQQLSDYQDSGFSYNNFSSWLPKALDNENELLTARDEYYGTPTESDIAERIIDRISNI